MKLVDLLKMIWNSGGFDDDTIGWENVDLGSRLLNKYNSKCYTNTIKKLRQIQLVERMWIWEAGSVVGRLLISTFGELPGPLPRKIWNQEITNLNFTYIDKEK